METQIRPDAPDVEKNEEDLIDSFLRASRLLLALSARSLDEASSPITFAQFRALLVISRGSANNQTQLAEELAVAPSSITRMVDRLEAAFLVERTRAGRGTRGLALRVTEKGEKVVSEVTERRRALIAEVVGKMPTDRVDELVDALDAFADAGEEPHLPGKGSVPGQIAEFDSGLDV